MLLNLLDAPRKLLALVSVGCVALLAFGMYLQHVAGLEPCPMCIVQRYAMVLIAIVAGLTHVPHVYLYASAALKSLGSDVEEAARMAGASPLQVARDVSLPSAPAAAITLQYVGPGFNAKTVAVSPSDATVLPGATQLLIATATDPTGAPVSDLIVIWTTSDSSIARITQTGNVTATVTARGPRGTVTFTAKAPTGVVGTGRMTVLPQAVRLAVIGGNGQTGVAGLTLATPLAVEVQATDGRTIAGALVNFRAVTAGGEVASASATTDAAGRARTIMVLGRSAGSYSFEASSGSLAPVTVGATATAAPIGPPTQLIPLTPLPTSFKVGVTSTQRLSAQIADANGYSVLQSGVAVTATMVVSPGGATSSVTAVSDALGIISMAIPAFNTAGSVLITLTSPVMPNLPYGTFTIAP